jgi:hypothetical protein
MNQKLEDQARSRICESTDTPVDGNESCNFINAIFLDLALGKLVVIDSKNKQINSYPQKTKIVNNILHPEKQKARFRND